MPDAPAMLHHSLLVGAMLFGVGLVGFVSRRNMIVMFLAAEMMLQGVSVSLVAWGRYHNDWGGQMLVLFILTVAACEAAIALALVLRLFRQRGSLDMAAWQELREDDQPAHVDREVSEALEHRAAPWPRLVEAGHQPEPDLEEVIYRPRV